MLFLEKKNEPVQSAYYIHVNVQRHCCSLEIWSAAPHIPMLKAGHQLIDLISLIIQTE